MPHGQMSKKDLTRSVRTIFKTMGFEYLKTEGFHNSFGGHLGEIDAVCVFENIVIACEETTDHDLRKHVKQKLPFFNGIATNKKEFIEWLRGKFPQSMGRFDEYTTSRYKFFFVYFHTTPVDDGTKQEFPQVKFVGERDIKYFLLVARCLKLTSINEMFRFLGLDLNEIGAPSSSSPSNDIESAVILPEDSSGFKDGIKIVTFLISAQDLMQCSYVLRKESWEEHRELYQRLLFPLKIRRLRKFIADNRRTFLNNIIVSLPDQVTFYETRDDGEDRLVDIKDIDNIINLKMRIPKRVNSIGLIDGQHRVFAHYSCGADEHEPAIADLRRKMHLLATGLVYPPEMPKKERMNRESQLFLEINSTQKRMGPDLIQHITALREPFGKEGVARNVLLKLDKRSPFTGMFQLSSLDRGKIKMPSIVRWGMAGLTRIEARPHPNPDRPPFDSTLFGYWQNDRKAKLLSPDSTDETHSIYEEYTDYCSNEISVLFNAVKEVFSEDWRLDRSSKLLSSTAINGFLISLRLHLEDSGKVESFAFYKERLARLQGVISFKKGEFTYGTSDWHALGTRINDICYR